MLKKHMIIYTISIVIDFMMLLAEVVFDFVWNSSPQQGVKRLGVAVGRQDSRCTNLNKVERARAQDTMEAWMRPVTIDVEAVEGLMGLWACAKLQSAKLVQYLMGYRQVQPNTLAAVQMARSSTGSTDTWYVETPR